MAVTITNPPEQGQMVSVRSRNWMVTDVSPSTLPPECLQTGLESPRHLLTLASVEDDGLGEELNVIWEARQSFFTIRLWDSGDLLAMIFKNHDKFTDDLKAELPLKRIWALVLEE